MSFNIGIGDCIAIIEVANRIRKDFSNAPSQFRDMKNEVRNLSIIAQDMEIDLTERDLGEEQKKELVGIYNSCRSVLSDIEDVLSKYSDLGSSAGQNTRTARRVWKRLKWEPQDVRDLRDRISSNIALLNAFNGRFTRDSITHLVREHDDRQVRDLLVWLSSDRYARQQSDYYSRRQPGTGQWFLASTEYNNWVKSSSQTLFCTGIPGAGKTMIASMVVQDLETRFQNDNIGIAYMYCSFQHRDQRAEEQLASVLKQFIQARALRGSFEFPESLKTLYSLHTMNGTRPSLPEITRLLKEFADEHSEVYIIVDALDECSEPTRKALVSEIFDLQAKCSLNLLATSRSLTNITSLFEGKPTIEICASLDDIASYVRGRLSELPSFASDNQGLQKDIIDHVTGAADGMFLLAKLHFDSLLGKWSPKAIRKALHNLPIGSDSYDSAYEEAMNRIEGQMPDQRALAKQVLSWMACSLREFTVQELQHALGVEPDESSLDHDNIPAISDIVSICAGLVTIDQQSNIIRLAHYTTQQYFERTWQKWFPHAHRDIAMTCLSYLSFETFASPCNEDEAYEDRLNQNSFYQYAAVYWGHHAQLQAVDEELALSFLQDSGKVSSSGQAMAARKQYSDDEGYSQRCPKALTGLHLVAHFGLSSLAETLISKGSPVNHCDDFKQTPLSRAAENGHENVTRILLKYDKVIDCPDRYGRTPLSLAAGKGHHNIVQLLLDMGANGDWKDFSGRTPLSRAAEKGHGDCVDVLIKGGVCLDARENSGRTPLSRAAQCGHTDMVQLLLSLGADADSRSHSHRTPLSRAAARDHEDVVRLLLDKGAEADSLDTSGRSPLSWAAENGCTGVVRLLLDHGAVPNNLPSKGFQVDRTPLLLAVEYGHHEVAYTLLSHASTREFLGIPADYSSLFWAVENGLDRLVHHLLGQGIDPNCRNNLGQTLLSYAAQNGYTKIAELLIAKGCEIEPLDDSGQTPFSWAARNGHADVLELFLSHDSIAPDKMDVSSGRTPLSHAAENGHGRIVRRLLDTQLVYPDSEDDDHLTPLAYAAANGHDEIVQILLDTGMVNPAFTQHGTGKTPLTFALENGHDAVVSVILATGCF